MIFYANRQVLFALYGRNTFGDSPGLQNAVHLQSKVIMQSAGRMFLHYEVPFWGGLGGPFHTRWLGRPCKLSFRLISGEMPWIFRHSSNIAAKRMPPARNPCLLRNGRRHLGGCVPHAQAGFLPVVERLPKGHVA